MSILWISQDKEKAGNTHSNGRNENTLNWTELHQFVMSEELRQSLTRKITVWVQNSIIAGCLNKVNYENVWLLNAEAMHQAKKHAKNVVQLTSLIRILYLNYSVPYKLTPLTPLPSHSMVDVKILMYSMKHHNNVICNCTRIQYGICERNTPMKPEDACSLRSYTSQCDAFLCMSSWKEVKLFRNNLRFLCMIQTWRSNQGNVTRSLLL